jgi:hypothetical protein
MTPTLDSFKSQIATTISPNPLFYGHRRAINLIHSQLRMNCSNLNAQLHSFYVEDNQECICMSGIKDCFHYFFICHLYHVERVQLFYTVHQLCDISLDSLLYGDQSLDVNEFGTI